MPRPGLRPLALLFFLRGQPRDVMTMQPTAARTRRAPSRLERSVNAYLERHPEARLVRAGRGRSPAREHVAEEDWGQPTAEDYCVYKPPPEWEEPALHTRRDHEIRDALLGAAARWWLERHPDERFVVIAAKSRLSGAVHRFRCGRSAAIVRWVERRWERQRMLAARYERCTCIVRDEPCPLCVEARRPAEAAELEAAEA